MLLRALRCLLVGLMLLGCGAVVAQEASRRRLRVGVDRAFAPYHYADSEGTARGFDVELLQLAAQEAGLDLEFRTGEWNEVRSWFDGGQLDLLSALFSSEERRRQYALSIPHSLVSFSIFQREHDAPLRREADLRGKRIFVQRRDVMSERLRRIEGITLIEVPQHREALRRLLAGEGDAAVLPKLVALQLIHAERLRGYALQDGVWPPMRFCFAAPKHEDELIQRLNEALFVLQETGKAQALWDRNVRFLQDKPLSLAEALRRMAWILVPLVGLAVVGLVLSWVLRRLVRKRTRELEVELAARRRAEASLKAYQEHLEELVAERTGALEESTRQFSLLVSHLPETVIIHRMGQVVYANATCLAVTGFSPEELTGTSILERVHPADREKVLERYRAYERGQAESYEVRMVTKDQRVVDVLVKPQLTTYEGQPAVLTILEDITWHHQMERELREATEAAEAANRAKSEFLANMSHEIRTPLNAVIGFAELLHASVKDPSLQGYTENIRAAGRSLLTLIGDILDLSKIEAGRLDIRLEPMEPGPMLRELRTIFELKAREKGLALELDLDPTLPAVLLLDSVRVRQVLVNLLGNALKFTHEGRVRMSARGLPPSGPGDLDLVLEVQDTGIGIPAEAHARIFDPFRQQQGQSTRLYGGTGLGLSISLRLAQLMGGSIELESEPGKGSTFRLRLPDIQVPLLPARTPCADHAFQDPLLPRFRRNCVLVVDDVGSNRLLVAECLRQVNLETLEAHDGREALERVAQQAPALVIMDIQMPEMDGIQAMQALKADEATRGIPVVAYTASSKALNPAEFLELGFDGFLVKPISIETLMRELARHLPLEPLARGQVTDPEPVAFAPGALVVLGSGLMPLVEACQGVMRPDRVRRVVQHLRDRAPDHPGLERLAESLEQALGAFDLGGIERLLNDLRQAVGTRPEAP